MAGRAARLPVPPVLLSVWSMSVRCRREVWERYRRSPYCHSSCCSSRTEPIRGRADSLSGKTRGDVCSALDLPVEPLDGVVGPDLGPVLAGEGGERGQVRLGVLQHLSDLGEGVPQGVDDLAVGEGVAFPVEVGLQVAWGPGGAGPDNET